MGLISSPFISTSLSNFAPESVLSLLQYSTALSQFSFWGDIGLFFKYFIVFSSGAIKPALAPASIDMLQIVMRSSMLKFSITGPAYSITVPVPPAVPIFPIVCNITSFDVTPVCNFPTTFIRKFLDFF